MVDLETTRRQLDDANSEIRQLLQERKNLRKERDAAFEAGARSMRERASRAASDAPGTPYTPTEAILALPLLPDGDTTEDQDRSDYDTAFDRGHTEGFAQGLRMGDARATDVEARLAALEKLTSDQADALEAQSRLIDQLRTGPQSPKAEDIPTRPYNAWTDG